MKRRYTAEEIIFMEEFVPGHSYQEIREEFLRRFGGEVTNNFPKSFIANHNLNTGRTGRFKKGGTPVNKGKEMSAEQYEKCKETMFKPGSTPKNTDPVGTEKMLGDGFIWVKIDDKPKVKKKENWIQKHRKINEEAHGPIPEGHYVIFLDGDRTNFDIENLAVISKAENARLNQNHLRFNDAELTKTGINIARVRTAIGKAKK